ncbi:hypothetical protein APHAL10511_005493 [Amanita phalloides]|nr:hypothetical protein APHAL10511_005493 [Amanita phalloides]
MGFLDSFDHLNDAYSQVTGTTKEHKASLTHEALSGAVAYQAAKAYEEHLAKNGKPTSHAKAKEIAAGLVGAALDHFVETKGLDFIDQQKARHAAQKHVEEVIITQY